MIFITLPSLRPKPPAVPVSMGAYTHGTTGKVSGLDADKFQEARRRDNIIKQLVKDCPYQAGDIVGVNSDAGKSLYGNKIQVIRIAQNYVQLGAKEWPEKGDNPLIVSASNGKETFFCTTNYLIPLDNKGC